MGTAACGIFEYGILVVLYVAVLVSGRRAGTMCARRAKAMRCALVAAALPRSAVLTCALV